MSLHPYLLLILACSLISFAVMVWDLVSRTSFTTRKRKLEAAAAREFEGAKPALIHASDTEIDKLPDTVDLVILEAKAQAVLSALLIRLLAANPLLSPGAALLTALLPSLFAALPKTLDVATYKAGLKDSIHKLITEAKL